MENQLAFNLFFKQKENVTIISEKAKHNLKTKKLTPTNVEERIHYFAVGHAFRHIDTDTLFKMSLSADETKKIPTRFIHLQVDKFPLIEEILKLLNDIRNINNHFIHDFNLIRLDCINDKIINFLKESFELASVCAYIAENNITAESFYNHPKPGAVLVNYWAQKFYPNQSHQHAERELFNKYTKQQAIEALLFINVSSDFDFKIAPDYSPFKIKNGRYLSFHACLFLMSMFLYKHEANKLISKVAGFKRNDNEQYRGKRDIFTFFAKKLASQDLNNEEQDLIKFRDIIQYLNHYPTAWNSELELQPKFPAMTNALKKAIVIAEINRCYPSMIDNESFTSYAFQQLWGSSLPEFSDLQAPLALTKEQVEKFNYELYTNDEIKNAEKTITDLKASKSTDKAEKIKVEEYKIRLLKKEGNGDNKTTLKLKERIKKDTFFTSYGRNQDCFMEYALRFLAEKNYFGENARFKTYKFYTIHEQEKFFDKDESPKHEKDKYKFHQGRMVHYCSYSQHLSIYPHWQLPFVIENNAAQVILTIADKDELISIQRSLMPYLLQEALDMPKIKDDNQKPSLIQSYCLHKKANTIAALAHLQQTTQISPAEKTKYKKLLPARLLHQFAPAGSAAITPTISSPLHKILVRAEQEEERYKLLLQKAIDKNVLIDFEKRNKGKRFKLMFIRKAWQLMFFQDIYRQNATKFGHHKHLHITRDEFNNFCKWMYGMDDVPAYKKQLQRLLSSKGFMTNKEFEALFSKSNTLIDLFIHTKAAYTAWLATCQPQSRATTHSTTIQYLQNSTITYINLSDFLKFLESNGKLNKSGDKIFLKTPKIYAPNLISAYYYKDKLPQEEYKLHRKLYNQLNTARLEDCFLYLIAFNYLKKSQDELEFKQIISPVSKILNSNITLKSKQSKISNIIPFAQIEKYVLTTDIERTKKLIDYVKKLTNKPAQIKDALDNINKSSINLKNILDINDHLLSSSLKFARLTFALERYLAYQNKLTLSSNNYIDIEGIPDLGLYVDATIRNAAFHSDIPKRALESEIQLMEQKIIDNIIRPLQPQSFNDLSTELKQLCTVLIKTNHNNFYPRATNMDIKEKHKVAQKTFFDTCIRTNKNHPEQP